jgi:peptidoglycan/xylan/chitin deacetylase (PgdA/CDA1 family)
LNGYILLLHLGADRKDKTFRLLEPLIVELRERGYELVRIDRMLEGNGG